MRIDLTAAARIVPLTALMLAVCVSERKYEQQTQQLQVARVVLVFGGLSFFAVLLRLT